MDPQKSERAARASEDIRKDERKSGGGRVLPKVTMAGALSLAIGLVLLGAPAQGLGLVRAAQAQAQVQVPFQVQGQGQGRGDALGGVQAQDWTSALADGNANRNRLVRPGPGPGPRQQLYGRFLHITDLHPDQFYLPGSAVVSGCHRDKPKKKKNAGKWRAGWWGAGVSDCDSPRRLISSTLRWLSSNWMSAHLDSEHSTNSSSSNAQGFDFILWTGDSARHDIDNKLPRTPKEIFESNRWVLEQVENAFPGVPIVPVIGNNDIFPHNIMFPGPNEVTKAYTNIWRDHVPEYEFHTFQRGAYFSKEVIPNTLAVISLNTLYFYDSNKAVDGCVPSKRKTPEKNRDPGTVQLDWLEVQLDILRRRGMQVHIIGHVPPTSGNYFDRCYDRYTDIVLRYQDTVVGAHFGHMNVDSFFVAEDDAALHPEDVQGDGVQVSSDKLRGSSRNKALDRRAPQPRISLREEGRIGIQGLPDDLRDDYATLPGRQRTNLDYYSVFFVAPSVVPTYLPSVRVWTYNTTLPRDGRPAALIQRDIPLESSESLLEAMEEDAETELGEEEEEDAGQPLHPTKRSHRRRHRKRKHHKKKKLPRYASPDSPSRRNTYLSMLGYSQWILDIDAANTEYEKVRRKQGKKEAEKLELEYKLEYTTYEPRTLWTEFLDDDKDEDESAQDVEERHVPVPKKLLRNELERLGTKPPSYALVRHVDVKDASSQLNDSTAAVADTDTDASKHHRHNGKRFKKKEGTKNRKRKKGKKGKGKLHVPRELKHFTDYALPHVTLEPMLELARHLALDAKLWKRYVRRIYSSSGATA